MDAYLKYVNKLHALGYSFEQIQALLVRQGIDQRVISILLANIKSASTSQVPVQAETQPQYRTQPAGTIEAYLEYVKALQARGKTRAEIDSALTSSGVDAQTKGLLFQLTSRTMQIKQPPTAPASQQPTAQDTKPEHQQSARTVTNNPLIDQSNKPALTNTAPVLPAVAQPEATKPDEPGVTVLLRGDDGLAAAQPEPMTRKSPKQDAEDDLELATEHLLSVADHLSKVADKLEAAEESAHTANIDEKIASNGQPLPNGNAEHISEVADHLSAVAEKLEANKAEQKNAQSSNGQTVGAGFSTPLAPPQRVASPISLGELPVAVEGLASMQAPPEASAPEQHPPIKKGPLAIVIISYCSVLVYALLTGAHAVTWLALLSMNVFGTVGFNLLLKRTEWKKVDPWFTAAVMQTGLALPFIIKEIINPIHFPTYAPFYLMLMCYCVLAIITLQICNVKALKYLEASVFSVVFNSRIVLATFFGAFFLSEKIGLWALLGGLLIFAAIFVIKQQSTRAIAKLGVFFGLGAAFAMSSMNTAEKELIKNVGYQQYIMPVWTAAAVILWIIVYARQTNAPYSLIFKPQGLTLMVVRACAGIGFTAALIFGPVAVSSYISSLSVVFLVIFGMLFLNEWDYLKSKIIATLMSISGLTFILVDKLK